MRQEALHVGLRQLSPTWSFTDKQQSHKHTSKQSNWHIPTMYKPISVYRMHGTRSCLASGTVLQQQSLNFPSRWLLSLLRLLSIMFSLLAICCLILQILAICSFILRFLDGRRGCPQLVLGGNACALQARRRDEQLPVLDAFPGLALVNDGASLWREHVASFREGKMLQSSWALQQGYTNSRPGQDPAHRVFEVQNAHKQHEQACNRDASAASQIALVPLQFEPALGGTESSSSGQHHLHTCEHDCNLQATPGALLC